MKMYGTLFIAGLLMTLGLAGCGGGGGGGGGITSGATTKVLIFGHISSSSRLSTIHASLTVPASVQVNYSSAPGATSGLCKLRKGVITPSGPVLVSTSDFDGSTYDIASRLLTINMVNNGRVMLKSSTTANSNLGAEIATIVFKLTTVGVLPTTMPLADPSASISQEMAGTPPSVIAVPGAAVNFTTTYQ